MDEHDRKGDGRRRDRDDKEKHHGNNNHHAGAGRTERGDRDRYDGPVDAQLGEYYTGLMREKEALDPKDFPNITRLVTQGMSQN